MKDSASIEFVYVYPAHVAKDRADATHWTLRKESIDGFNEPTKTLILYLSNSIRNLSKDGKYECTMAYNEEVNEKQVELFFKDLGYSIEFHNDKLTKFGDKFVKVKWN